MNKSLADTLERVKSWPPERQRDVAELLEDIERAGTVVYQLSDEERRLIQEGLDEANRGEFVSDADMAAFWNRNKNQ